MAKKRKNPWPPTGKVYDLLRSFLMGQKHTIGSAFNELNCGVLSARSAELRKMGWPVNSHTMPHPKFPDEKIKQYSFDTHFLAWWGDGRNKHPFDYPHHDGRGKFTEEEFEDDTQDETEGSDPAALTGVERFLADAQAV